MLWWGVVAAILLLQTATPWLAPRSWLAWSFEAPILLLLGVIALTLLWHWRRAPRQPWGRVAIVLLPGVVCWLLADVLYYRLPDGDSSSWWWAVQDALYTSFFLSVLLAQERVDKRIPWGLGIAFVAVMYAYLVLLPLGFARAEYESWLPSYLLYLYLDAFLALRCYQAALATDDGELHARQKRAALAFLVLFVGDVTDWLWTLGLVPLPWHNWGTALSAWRFLPLLAMVSPLLRYRLPPRCQLSLHWLVRAETEPLTMLLLPLGLHLAGYGLAVFDGRLHAARDGLILVWLLGVFAYLWWQRRRRRIAQRFHAWRPVASEQGHSDAGVAEVFTSAGASPAPRDPLLARIDLALLRRLDQRDFRLESLAAELAISPRHLQRRLKAATGQTPAEYLRSVRLRRAASMLCEGHKVAYVAEAVGFSQAGYFARLFKAEFGCTPSEYPQRLPAQTAK